MPIVTSAFLPPSPLLIPEIGKENLKILTKTIQSYDEFANNLKDLEVEVLIIISAHCPIKTDRIALNIAPDLNLNFKEFGLLKNMQSFVPPLGLSSAIEQELGFYREIKFISESDLDYGSAVPLYMLSNSLKAIKILPIYTNNKLEKSDHYKIGQQISIALQNRPEKIAIIASGSLSSKLKKNSPSGYSPKGARFDHKIIELLKNQENIEKIINFDKELAHEVMEKGLNQLCLLIGLINSDFQTKILSYQDDFGIGYLSASLNVQIAQI